ncbi:MAG: glycoside hydrolase family 31 protein [Bacteroidales bacterium]
MHWGGDAANTDNAMLSTLRAGLSFGLSGFTFWSHDIGGFVHRTPEELYRRWLPFGMLTSGTAVLMVHPAEPWLYNESFNEAFAWLMRWLAAGMPYIYAQSKYAAENGLPMVRALFVEYPHDAGSWLVEDEYLFGSDMLVAPLFEANMTGRDVYLPEGNWIDYQTGKSYSGGWHHIESGVPGRGSGARRISHPAYQTGPVHYANGLVIDRTGALPGQCETAKGLICLPSDNILHEISCTGGKPDKDPLREGEVAGAFTKLVYLNN